MIDDCLFESRPDHNRKKPFTLAVSTIVHVLIAGTLIIIPLMQTQAMPPLAPPPPVQLTGPQIRTFKLAATPHSANRASQVSPATPQSDIMIAPLAVPREVVLIDDAIDAGFGNLLRAGNSFGPGTGLIGAPGGVEPPPLQQAAPPPLPPAPVPPPAPKMNIKEPVRVSSTLQRSRLIRQVDPVYPPLARTARVEGTVVMEARITENGTVDSLRVVSGNPLLVPSVLDAVKQWRYEPTLLNGEPIEIITTITVNFTLR